MDIYLIVKEIVLYLVAIGGVVGIWWLNKYFSRMNKLLKDGVNAQKDIIDSFLSQSDYFKKTHETVKDLYNMENLKDVVNIMAHKKTEQVEKKYEDQISDLKNIYNETAHQLATALLYLLSSVSHIPEDHIEIINDTIAESIEEYIQSLNKSENTDYEINSNKPHPTIVKFVNNNYLDAIKRKNRMIETTRAYRSGLGRVEDYRT